MSIPTKSLEFLMEAWRDHSKTGFHVTFLVNPLDQEFFKSCPDGQRFTAVLVKLTDQDEPAPLPTKADLLREEKKRIAQAEKDALKPGLTPAEAKAQEPLPLPDPKKEDLEPMPRKFPAGFTGLAVKWCGDTHFQSWMQGQYPDHWAEKATNPDFKSTEDIAKAVLCDELGIESRTELNTDEDASGRFNFEIRGPYQRVREHDGIDETADAPF